ncbi:MAG: DUF302 domain-containing protein [Thermoplasmatota archaeon]
MGISLQRTAAGVFEDVVERITANLAEQGFGILTTIDLQAKFREKLHRKSDRYVILAACNPALAWEAVGAVPELGVLLPCNVIVREAKDGQVIVDAMDPGAALALVDDPTVAKVAADARSRLTTALDAL